MDSGFRRNDSRAAAVQSLDSCFGRNDNPAGVSKESFLQSKKEGHGHAALLAQPPG
jgi:hypothetical protein